MKSYLHEFVVLANTAKKLMLISTIQNVTCPNHRKALYVTIRINCKHNRVWIQDICKKSTVLAKKYWENILLSINSVIDDRLTCNVNKVYKYMILVVSIYALLITMGLLI